ncbi:MAG: hypothetical protein BWY79_00857 [Actinobacteria bacterium ADurb.Bin444]|nr:MAG: hypothetical protein BWY79_00857 [Actinobacteria bacterium ADurb.Bin444]
MVFISAISSASRKLWTDWLLFPFWRNSRAMSWALFAGTLLTICQ